MHRQEFLASTWGASGWGLVWLSRSSGSLSFASQMLSAISSLWYLAAIWCLVSHTLAPWLLCVVLSIIRLYNELLFQEPSHSTHASCKSCSFAVPGPCLDLYYVVRGKYIVLHIGSIWLPFPHVIKSIYIIFIIKYNTYAGIYYIFK